MTQMSQRPQAPQTKRRASHDIPTPKALVDFMMKDWKPAPKGKQAPVKAVARFSARRKALSAMFPGETLVIPTGHEKVRANDTHYLFRPGTDFFYLTGNEEPDCVLVLEPKGKKGHRSILFAQPNPGRSDTTFFTDREKGELWVGPRLGLRESKQRFGVDECRDVAELKDYLKPLKSQKSTTRVLRGLSDQVDSKLPAQKTQDEELAVAISKMRLVKDAMELAALKRAADATKLAFEDVIRVMKTAKNEREIEGAFMTRSRIEGNGPGYNVIAAAGPNACILHWNRNDGRVRRGDLLLLDAGVETHELYTADVTRTLPINGKFSRAQREIYDMVLAAQSAAIAEIAPGNNFLAPHEAAMRVLAEGLVQLGILPMSAEEALHPKKQYYKRYTLHGTSHMLGMDVHDCSKAGYRDGTLEVGMVLTVEPGLYFQLDDLTVPSKYRGIGIRIEDDVVVTSRGSRVLTDVPRTSDDVERWIKRVWGA